MRLTDHEFYRCVNGLAKMIYFQCTLSFVLAGTYYQSGIWSCLG